jgi:hypothetical protein
MTVRTLVEEAAWPATSTRVRHDWSLILTSPDRTWQGIGADWSKVPRDLQSLRHHEPGTLSRTRAGFPVSTDGPAT